MLELIGNITLVTVRSIVILGALAVGCASAESISTDSLAVKQMKVNGVDLAYVEEGIGADGVVRPRCFWRLAELGGVEAIRFPALPFCLI